jgi:HK97 gp10 family phage protein
VTQVFSLLGFVAKLKAIEHDMDALGPAIVIAACKAVAAEAKRVLGEGYPEWPALQPETIARKMHGNTPLLETGEMRASIEWTAHGLHGEVGSNSDIAVYQEFGTSRIPPRPFLAGAAMRMEPEIHKLAARAVMAVVAGRGLHGSEMAELLHLLHTIRHVGHVIGEAMDAVLDSPEDDNRKRR